MPCGHDTLAYREWLHSAAAKVGDKLGRRRVREDFALAVGGQTQNRAVLRNDSIEERVLRENLPQFGKLASGCQNQFPAGSAHALESFHSAGPTTPVVGDSAVVIANQTKVAHTFFIA